MFPDRGRRRRRPMDDLPPLRRSPRLQALRSVSARPTRSDWDGPEPRGRRSRAPSSFGGQRGGRAAGFDTPVYQDYHGRQRHQTPHITDIMAQRERERGREIQRQPVYSVNDPRIMNRDPRLPALGNDPPTRVRPGDPIRLDAMRPFYQRPRRNAPRRISQYVVPMVPVPGPSGSGDMPRPREIQGSTMGLPQADMLLGSFPLEGHRRSGTPMPGDQGGHWMNHRMPGDQQRDRGWR